MKLFSTLFVIIALITSGSVKAQTGSKLNGTTYTVVIKDAVNGGEEIIDHMTFENGQLVSEKLKSEGYTSKKLTENSSASESNFNVTMSNPKEGTKVVTGKVFNNSIDGTILYTDKSGNQTTYAFRGMTTADWNQLQDDKRAAREAAKQQK